MRLKCGWTPRLASISLLLLTAACSAAPRGAAQDAWREYLDVHQRLRSAGGTLEAGGDEERQAIERFRALMSDLKAPGFASEIRDVYAEGVFFNDTLKTLRGVSEVEEHLIETAAALDSATVEFLDLTGRGGDYYFRWVMTTRSPKLAKGQEILSVGMTHVRFDAAGRVVLHQDFWDSTGGLFEHAPGLGWLLRRTKQRL